MSSAAVRGYATVGHDDSDRLHYPFAKIIRLAHGGAVVKYRTGVVQSADGTLISHRVIGEHGPPIILVHGGLQAAQNFQRLAEHLSPRFTMYVPDRRGRRPETPAGEAYGLMREGEDLDALMRAVAARHIFGLSSGATIALYAALHFPGVEKLALYEPPLTIDGADPAAWVPKFERSLGAGGGASAMAEILKGTGDRELITRLPRVVLIPLLRMLIEIDGRRVSDDEIALKDLIPTMHLDSIVQRESVTMVNPRIPELRSDVLLVGGQKSALALHSALDSLAKRLPSAKRVELDGVGHIAADNRGAPDKVARILEDFFAS